MSFSPVRDGLLITKGGLSSFAEIEHFTHNNADSTFFNEKPQTNNSLRMMGTNDSAHLPHNS